MMSRGNKIEIEINISLVEISCRRNFLTSGHWYRLFLPLQVRMPPTHPSAGGGNNQLISAPSAGLIKPNHTDSCC